MGDTINSRKLIIFESVAGIFLLLIGLSSLAYILPRIDINGISILDFFITIVILFIIICPVVIAICLLYAWHKDSLILNSVNLSISSIILAFSLLFFQIILFNFSIINHIGPFGLSVDHKIAFGDLLTPITIFISVSIFLYSWRHDQQQKTKKDADIIKGSASTILAKLNRRKQIRSGYFRQLEPLLLHTVNLIINKRDTHYANEYLRSELISGYSELQRRIDDEQIEILVKDLYGYSSLRISFDKAFKEIIFVEDLVFMNLQKILQNEVDTIRYGDNLLKCINVNSDTYEIIEKMGKYDLFNELNFSAYMAWYEDDYLIKEIIRAFELSISDLINEQDDAKIAKKEVSIFYNPYRPIKIKMIEGLKLRYTDKYNEAIECYNSPSSIETNTGLEAGKYLAYKSLEYSSPDANKAKKFKQSADGAYKRACGLSLDRNI
ncbi:MAG: hypothetical protein PHQ34_06555 [Methanothrix sp.]|nr:hypothetical protein [Methanothrix sp.]